MKTGATVSTTQKKTPSRAAEVGLKVLEGFEKGRCIAIAQAKARSAQRAAAIILLFNEDVTRGKPARGRAGRIARRMTERISESQVRKIIARTQFSVRDSLR